MKIGFVLDGGLERPDGVQQYILSLGGWMEVQGHEVRYLIAGKNPQNIPHVISLARNIGVRFNGNALSIPLPASSRKIKHMLQREKFDVIHVQTPHSPLMGAKVVHCAYKRSVIVGTFHILPFGLMSRLGTRLLGVALHFNLKKFDTFLSVSKPAADFAAYAFKINSSVVPNMVHAGLFRPTQPKPATDTLNLLFLGRLVPRKGCQQLLKALSVLKSEGKLPSNVRLDICSDGSMRAQLEAYVIDHDLSEHVTFHGFVSHEQKVEFMRNADISIFPSLSGESFGIVLIEAMAAGGGIVLGGDNPGYRSVLEDVPGSIIDAHHPEILATQLHAYIGDAQKRDELFARQQEHVEQFDIEVVARHVLSVYETCINDRINQ